MDRDAILKRTAQYVKNELYDDTSGHDWWHIDRVRKLALAIGEREGADRYIVELAALLHDISDYKLNGGDHSLGRKVAYDWLRSLGESHECADLVAEIVANVSFKGAGTSSPMQTKEGLVVQDADRLDALGAIGVARAFAYGGSVGEAMHEPGEEPTLHETAAEYHQRGGTVINHFYEKLLLLRDRMNTDAGRQIAERRHAVLEAYLREFLTEWDAQDLDC